MNGVRASRPASATAGDSSARIDTTGKSADPKRDSAFEDVGDSESIVFVSPTIGRGSQFGGGKLSIAMLDTLRRVCRGRVQAVSLGHEQGPAEHHVTGTGSRIQTALNNVVGYSGTLTRGAERQIMELIDVNQATTVWLDSSLLGRLAQSVKRRCASTRVVAYFHNIEFDMQRTRMRQESAWYAIACASDWLNERLSLHYADACMMLTAADSHRADRLYGRRADVISPVSLPDSRPSDGLACPPTVKGPYVLFVGAVFGPNLEAAHYIADHLAPLFPEGLRALIVGRGFEAHVRELSRMNVEVFGAVDDLAPYYAGASLVLAPVFSGGGMKVKIAEALMHGKRVLASPSAAMGYEASVRSGSTVICEAPGDFIAACTGLPEAAVSCARRDYETHYSMEANAARVSEVLLTPKLDKRSW